LADLRAVAGEPATPEHTLDPVAEICVIGLVAYFEAFCKGHFASMINIHPPLIRNLEERGREVTVRASDLIELDEPVLPRLGFLVAERYEFGTPKLINSLYTDLVQRTPFTRDEADRFSALLDDRHLLVHHGGIFTPRYAKERFVHREVGRSRLFLDSLLVSRNTFLAAADFIEFMSDKIRKVTSEALRTGPAFEKISLSPSAKKALDNLDAKTFSSRNEHVTTPDQKRTKDKHQKPLK
jgi:hypothetical protein